MNATCRYNSGRVQSRVRESRWFSVGLGDYRASARGRGPAPRRRSRCPAAAGSGTGLGRALLDAAEGSARDAGWDTIGLSVTVSNPDNELARSIYRRRGYRDSGQGEFHDGYHYHDAAGVRRYHGEQHVYLVKRLGGAGS
jgi:hypothetical protein